MTPACNAARADSPHDDLFHGLDGRRIAVQGRSWRLRVHSVRLLHDILWIQLDAVGTPTFVLTLRQQRFADAAAVLAVLRQYFTMTQHAEDPVVFDLITADAYRTAE
jgi:hypothetical protein